jgi:hypothetical protein
MTKLIGSDLRSRLENLKTEMEQLSLELLQADRDRSASLNASSGSPGEHDGPGERRQRVFRDLLWQGRWGLAWHLARACEAQGDGRLPFTSSMIRRWAIVSPSVRQPEGQARSLLLETLAEMAAAESRSEPRRLLDWATVIAVSRSLSKGLEPAALDRVTMPASLPATSRWWREYVAGLSGRRQNAIWTAMPVGDDVEQEINELMILSEDEAVRLAASCLRIAIRGSMRHVQVPAAMDEGAILNWELARSTSISLGDDGRPASMPEEIETAVCALAAETPHGRRLMLTEMEPNQDESPAVAPSIMMETEETDESTPAMVLPFSAASSTTPSLLPVVSEAREEPPRLEPVIDVVVGEVESKEETVAARVSATDRVNPPVVDPSRRLHEQAVAAAFGVPAAWNAPGPAPAAARVDDNTSLWSAFLSPQAAIVAGLLAITVAIIAGLGSGLRAGTVVDTAPAASDETAEAVVDFPEAL